VSNPFALWSYLSAGPLLWLTVTVLAWVVADAMAQACGRHPLANPMLMSVAMVAALLLATRTPYATYFAGAQFVHFLLGPATVAIAVPLYRNWPTVARNALPMAAALLVGSLTAIASALAIAAALGVPRPVLIALAPKSITAAVAMGISEGLGGAPALTAVLVITTGLIGAVTVTPLMNALGIRNYAARGFAAGLAAHGIGTARAFTVDPIAGTFAGIAMGLNALLSSILVPLIVKTFL
jgi:predicted murein hydrolase (TIGR00659 family)